MKRTKKASQIKRSLPTSGPSTSGPKSKCTDEVVEQAYRLCLLSLNDRELAIAFNVSKQTISHWLKVNEEFRQAVKKGRMHADARVAEALYERALGYEHPAVKILTRHVKEYDADGKVIKSYTEPMKVAYMKKYPPDVKAAIKWLGVRNRETWGESYKVEHKHAHMFVDDVNIHSILDQVSDTDKFTDEELRVAAKLGLTRASKQITESSNN